MVVMADSSASGSRIAWATCSSSRASSSRERLDEALADAEADAAAPGPHPLHGQHITPKDLRDALQVQVSQIVFKVFRWRDGEYQFAPADTRGLRPRELRPMSADFILMEGIRMVDEWPIIEKKIPSMDIVFRPVVDPSLDRGGLRRRADDVLRRGSGALRGRRHRARSASLPRRSASSARSTACGPCRRSSTRRGPASSRSAAPCSTSSTATSSLPPAGGRRRSGRGGGRHPCLAGAGVRGDRARPRSGRPGPGRPLRGALRRHRTSARPAPGLDDGLLPGRRGRGCSRARPRHPRLAGLRTGARPGRSRTSSRRGSWTRAALRDPGRRPYPLRAHRRRVPPDRRGRRGEARGRKPLIERALGPSGEAGPA